MYILERNQDIIQKYKKNFLCFDRDGTPLDPSLFKNKCVIYVIENLESHKKYVGKTINLNNRATNYIYAFRHNDSRHNRSIIKAMIDEGIDKFRMYPICIVQDRDKLASAEKWFVELYDLTNPLKGYNEKNPESYVKDRTGVSRSHTTSTKILKSKPIACINPDTKHFLISVGMKLFGDYVGTSKDQVKNCARRGIRHKGYYVIYLATNDRVEIYNKRQLDYEQYKKWKISSNKLKYQQDKYEEYFSYVKLVELFLADQSIDALAEENYKCEFLAYSDTSEDSYELQSIDAFISLLQSDSKE